MLLIDFLFIIVALLLLIPIVVLTLESVAASQSIPSVPTQLKVPHPRTAVLVPAHNEAVGIAETLETLMSQVNGDDKIVVIADNCTDDTANICRSLGVAVIERHDSQRKGKGYALDYGLRFLEKDPPDVIFIVDADCHVKGGTVEDAARLAITLQRPIQVPNILLSPSQPRLKDLISTFAFKVNTCVRPRGLARMGFPCLLQGTGMAFTWPMAQKISLASSNIVEDIKLTVDLALSGYIPYLSLAGGVVGELPQNKHAGKMQRTRWEHGHLETLLTQVPNLLKASFKQRQVDLLVMALDLGIPPLSLLLLLWAMLMLTVSIWAAIGASWGIALFVSLEGVLLCLSVFIAWLKFGRNELPAKSLIAVPFYIIWKIPIYLSFFINPQKDWIRTERE